MYRHDSNPSLASWEAEHTSISWAKLISLSPRALSTRADEDTLYDVPAPTRPERSPPSALTLGADLKVSAGPTSWILGIVEQADFLPVVELKSQ